MVISNTKLLENNTKTYFIVNNLGDQNRNLFKNNKLA